MQSMSIICEAEKSADDLADRIIPITLFRFPEHQATKKADRSIRRFRVAVLSSRGIEQRIAFDLVM